MNMDKGGEEWIFNRDDIGNIGNGVLTRPTISH